MSMRKKSGSAISVAKVTERRIVWRKTTKKTIFGKMIIRN
jgi:hypothetical protein